MMAFSVTDIKNPYQSILDPTILSLYVGLKVIENGVNTANIPVMTHICNQTDINNFYAVRPD